jgi:cobalt-precorrin-7 (C5)-methyltransferase
MTNPGTSSSDPAGLPVSIVAVGPGDSAFLTIKGKQTLEQADIVTGFTTVLNVVSQWTEHAEVCPMTYRDQEDVLEYAVAEAKKGRKLAVCCWGDLNVSAMELLERVSKRASSVDLVPGISSVQIAMARTGIPLEDTLFITLHRREGSGSALEELVHYLKEGRRHIVLLPRPFDLMPAAIASGLLDEGIAPERALTVYQRLTLDGEKTWKGTLAECAAITEEFSDLTIMVFGRPDSHPV